MEAHPYQRFILGIVTLLAAGVITACGGGSTSSGGLGQQQGGGDGSVTLSWEVPTTNEDGSCLTDLYGYEVRYGLAMEALDRSERVPQRELSCTDIGETTACGAVSRCSYEVDNLASASWYLVVHAVDTNGNLSDPSAPAVATVQ